jgi:hypothetical protein
MAEASATISPSFARRLFAPFGNQLSDQVPARTVEGDDSLGLAQCLLRGTQTQLPFSDRLHNQLIARLQAGGRAALSLGITIRPCWLMRALPCMSSSCSVSETK